MSNLMIELTNLQQENYMAKQEIQELKRQIVDEEMENQQLRVALKWCAEQLRYLNPDHDCKQSPDSGCSWCWALWQAESLVGITKPEGEPDEGK